MMAQAGTVVLPDVEAADRYLRGQVAHTPVRRLAWLEHLVGVPVWAKLECHQQTGSFKYRGAKYRLRTARGRRGLVAASAGNHGLAVAEAAREAGVVANVCIPATASRLKRDRILASGAGLLEHGATLGEAIRYARRYADDRGWDYISPYNDPDVIAGNGTVAPEFLGQVGGLATLIVPVGGGGLAVGMAIGARVAGWTGHVFGCEPERSDSLSRSLAAGHPVPAPFGPTLADGLAVDLEPDAITPGLAAELLVGVVRLREEDLAGAVLALLTHESLLVEPAGAAGVAACLRLAREGRLTGPVGVPLGGGNIQLSALARIQSYPFTDPEWVRILRLRGPIVADVPIGCVRGAAALSGSAEQDPAGDLTALLNNGLTALDEARLELDEYSAYCAAHGLPHDQAALGGLAGHTRWAADRVRGASADLNAEPGSADRLVAAETAWRLAVHTAAYARRAFEWCSPAYDQSRVTQFFSLAAQDRPTVNYERYEGVEVGRVESQLLAAFGVSAEAFAATACASGMAAYTLIEAFLLRHRLRPGDRVLVAPYIYFEAAEQLARLPGVEVVPATGYGVAELLADIRRFRPRVVFADPLANDVDQRLIDLDSLLAALRQEDPAPTLVVDGTMLSGLGAERWLVPGDPVEVLYYESGSKYLQLGLDAGMIGVVVHQAELRPLFDRLRRNAGLIPTRTVAQMFPEYDCATFRRRMVRIGRNALRVASRLANDPAVTHRVAVVYPGLPDHPDHQLAACLPYAGGCVTFRFRQPGWNRRELMDALIHRLLNQCRANAVPVSKGVSFGFLAPRICAAASMAESIAPFMRLYSGDLGPDPTDRLADILADELSRSPTVDD